MAVPCGERGFERRAEFQTSTRDCEPFPFRNPVIGWVYNYNTYTSPVNGEPNKM